MAEPEGHWNPAGQMAVSVQYDGHVRQVDAPVLGWYLPTVHAVGWLPPVQEEPAGHG